MRIGLSLKLSEPKYNVLAQNIRALFADGSQGWWYDDNDTTTLFQDSAGTTPVTAVEQFVGLQLDKSRGLVLGSEQSPGLAAFTLTASGTWSPSGAGYAFVDTVGGQVRPGVEFPSTSVPSGWYRLTFTVGSITGATQVRVDGVGASDILAGTGTYTGTVFLSATSKPRWRIEDTSTTIGDGFTLSNVSMRAIPGNHRYAPASGNRPIWSKRVNLLTKTEQFNDAVWANTIAGTGVAATVTADQGTAPDGTNTADRIQFNLGGGTTTSDITRRRQSYTTPASSHTFSVYLRSFDGISSYNMHIVGPDGGTNNIVVTGAWQRFAVTATGTGSAVAYAVGLRGGQTPANSNTADILAWAADLRPTNQATGLLPLYQRVNTSSDYDTNGFPGYLKADGVDDFLQTNSINFTATDKITLCAGLRKLSDAAAGTVVDINGATGTNSFMLRAPAGATATYAFYSGGSVAFGGSALSPASYTSPITNVLTGVGDISGDSAILRINGAQAVAATGDQGTGNYSNLPVYFFRRQGTALPFTGYEYGNVAVGKLLTADQLTALETYMNGLTRAY